MRKRIIVGILLVILVCLTAGCGGTSSQKVDTDVIQQQTQEQILNDQNNQIGLPNIKNYTEKKMAKEIMELRDNAELICYAYTKNEYTGKYVFEGKCMGFGLPYSAQYTNPQKVNTVEGGEYGALNPYTIAQADPNGLFMPDSANATWLMMINESTGKREAAYYEVNVIVKQSKISKRLCDESSLPKDY
jgi:hypothetical protein